VEVATTAQAAATRHNATQRDRKDEENTTNGVGDQIYSKEPSSSSRSSSRSRSSRRRRRRRKAGREDRMIPSLALVLPLRLIMKGDMGWRGGVEGQAKRRQHCVETVTHRHLF